MEMPELLKRIPYTQLELADMIGVSQASVSQFVNGRYLSLKVAHAFDVIAAVESGTAHQAAKAVQQRRIAKAQRRLAKLGIDISLPSDDDDDDTPTPTPQGAASEAKPATPQA